MGEWENGRMGGMGEWGEWEEIILEIILIFFIEFCCRSLFKLK